ncbi:MAG: hypothetical protein IJ158_09115 [Treponema sp.]|nr:hypothetical protein [Treponema sp.]
MSEVAVAVWNSAARKYVNIDYRRVMVRKSLDEICHYVELEIPESERNLVHKHGIIQVRYLSKYITESRDAYAGKYGYHPVTTVYIDYIDEETQKDTHGIVVTGRSAARDIIDSKWSGTILGQPTLLQILRQIAGEFDFKEKDVICLPTTAGDITKTVFSFSWENESPWAKLLTVADAQGLIITSNQLGGLYIEQPARSACNWGFAIEEGVNVRHPRRSESGMEQYHEYIVNCCNKVGKAIDNTCPNKRKLTINLSEFIIDQEKLNRRAKTEMLRRREDRVVCTLSGWGLTEAQIQRLGGTYHKEIFWEVNLLIPVKLPSCKVNANMLISQVEYTAEKSAFSCDVTLVKPEAYR